MSFLNGKTVTFLSSLKDYFFSLVNVGNSCYMNSVLQAVLQLPGFKDLLHSHKHAPQIKKCPLLRLFCAWKFLLLRFMSFILAHSLS